VSHVFRHPKYYKELQASLKKEAISPEESTDSEGRAPSDKQQAIDETVPHCDIEEATSVKHQATPDAGCKRQAPSNKRQASSRKRQAP
jgi:hypothetical protein